MAELQFRAEGIEPERRRRLPASTVRPALLLVAAAILVVAYSSGRTYVSVNPASLDFGLEPVAALSPPRSVTLTNQGSERLRNPAATLVTADFTISSNGCMGALDPGEKCVMELRFTPQAEGSRVARLQLPQLRQQVALSGTAFPRDHLVVSPAAVDFGPQQILSDSPPKTIRVSNQSPVSLTLEAGIQQDPNREFAIGGNDCGVLQPNQTCTISVRFHPHAESTVSSFLTVHDSSGYSPRAVKLTGTGQAPGVSHIDIQPGSLSFDAQNLHVPSPEQSITISSTGNQPVRLLQIAKGGEHAQDFEITRDGCSATMLQPAQTCSLAIRFRPSVQGTRSALVTVLDNSGDGPHEVTLMGSGVVPTFARARVTPRRESFGEQEIAKPSEVRYITIISDGTAPLKLSAATLAGAGASSFSIGPDECSQVSLAHGKTCQIGVRFAPASFGMKTAELVIRDNGAAGSESVYLEGDGIPKAVASAIVDPPELRFKPGETQSITVTSTGSAKLEIGTAGIKGTGQNGFTIGNNTCDGANLARGSKCGIEVVFSPRAVPQQATLFFPDNTPNQYERVSLVGTHPIAGFPGFRVSPGELHFPDTPERLRSQPQFVNITSTSAAPLPKLSITLLDSNFERTSPDCFGLGQAPTPSCRLNIVFTPQSAGPVRATVLVGDGISTPQSVVLSGTGLRPPIASPVGWCCYNGQTIQTSASACERYAGYFSLMQAQAQRACSVTPPPKLGWCCAQGKIEQISEETCARSRGFFSLDAAEAQKACSVSRDELGWCCANGKTGQTTQAVCGRARGFFSFNQAEVQNACGNAEDQLGWCCANGKTEQTTQANCTRARGFFSLNPAEAQKACSVAENQLGWCCANGRTEQTTQAVCARARGFFSLNPAEAQKACSVTENQLGWCCANGRTEQITQAICTRARGFFSFNQAEVQKACGNAGDQPGWCCANGKTEQTTQAVCARARGFFSLDQTEVRKACSVDRNGGNTGNELGWCCANGKAGQASQVNCARQRGFFSFNLEEVRKVCSSGRTSGFPDRRPPLTSAPAEKLKRAPAATPPVQ